MSRALDETPYWQQFLPEPSPVPKGEIAESCDITVIGGGFTGLSAAIHLARAGAEVAVFERDRLGWGASTRNGGQTLPGLKLSAPQLVKKFGLSKARRFWQVPLDAIDYLEAFLDAEGIDCGFKRHGGLWAAYTPGHLDALRRAQVLLKEQFSHETHLVEKEDLRTELGTDFYHGGLIDPSAGGLNAGKYMLGLIETASKYKVRLHENTEIVDVRRDGDGFRVSTRNGQFSTGRVAVATNGYTPSFLTALRRRIIPIGSSIVVTEPLDEALAPKLIPRGRMIFDTKNFLNYFRILEDNRLLFGGRASMKEIGPAESAVVLHRGMTKIFPELASVAVERSWSGYVGFTFDRLPHLGVEDGLYYAMGFCGHGVANGFYFGSRLALLIQGKLQDFPFLDLRFPTMFLYREKPWFLPIAGFAYGLKDRFAR